MIYFSLKFLCCSITHLFIQLKFIAITFIFFHNYSISLQFQFISLFYSIIYQIRGYFLIFSSFLFLHKPKNHSNFIKISKYYLFFYTIITVIKNLVNYILKTHKHCLIKKILYQDYLKKVKKQINYYVSYYYEISNQKPNLYYLIKIQNFIINQVIKIYYSSKKNHP